MRLERKVAIVTGGASGIGYAIAHRFAAEGARVAILDLDQAGCDRSAREIVQSTGGDVLAIRADVTDESDVQAAIDATVNRYGAIDILVSNAGIQIISSV